MEENLPCNVADYTVELFPKQVNCLDLKSLENADFKVKLLGLKAHVECVERMKTLLTCTD